MYGSSPSGARPIADKPAVSTSSIVTSGGTMAGEASMGGGKLRAYDQLLPKVAEEGDIVIIGSRSFIWRANLARWRPNGPVFP